MTTFTVSAADKVRIAEWEAKHPCKFRTSEYGIDDEVYVGANAGSTKYSFIPTGLGTVFTVHCACGAELDLTVYDKW